MKEESYTKGMRCPNPECSNKECFEIELDPVIAVVTEDTIEADEHAQTWGNQSWCRCYECNETATVGQFKTFFPSLRGVK